MVFWILFQKRTHLIAAQLRVQSSKRRFSILFLSQRVHVLSLLQNKFGLVFFRLFDGALETSNFRLEEAQSAITLLRCFLHENTQRGKIARVKFAEELGTMSKNRLTWITLVRGPIWGIHSLTLMISCLESKKGKQTIFNQMGHRQANTSWQKRKTKLHSVS